MPCFPPSDCNLILLDAMFSIDDYEQTMLIDVDQPVTYFNKVKPHFQIVTSDGKWKCVPIIGDKMVSHWDD